jgi:hypothetical protein
MTCRCPTGRLGTALMLVNATAAVGPAFAQGVLEVRPSISASQVYESNLFATRTGRQEDYITRVTPAIEGEYRSPVWTLSGKYSLDAERFSEHSELSAGAARQLAGLHVDYRPASRLTFATSAEYLDTRNPAELNVGTALSFARSRASRLLSRSSIKRHLTPLMAGTLEYTFNSDRLSGFEASEHSAQLGLTRRLSPRTSVTSRYRLHRLEFSQTTVRSAVVSHALTAGLTHAVTRNVSVTLDAGPRLTGDELRPRVGASIDWRREPIALSLAYGHTQGTAIGLVGAVDTQSLHATVIRQFGRSREVRIAPGMFRSALGAFHAEVYVLGVGLTQHLPNGLAIDLSFDGARQRGTLLGHAGDVTIPRHTILMRVIADPTRRQPVNPE